MNSTRITFSAICAVIFVTSTLLFSQNLAPDEVRVSSRAFVPQSATALRVASQFVEVGAVVRDTRGRAIAGLKQTDFQVLDDNKPQTIATFNIETLTSTEPPSASATNASATLTPSPSNAPTTSAMHPSARRPRNVAIYIDDIHTEAGDLARSKIAAESLVKSGVEPGDRLALVTGSSTVTLDFTTDSAKVLDAISHLQAHPRMSPNGVGSCPRITPYEAYVISNHMDTVIEARAIQDTINCQCGGEPDAACAKGAQQIVEALSQSTWELAKQVSLVTFGTLKGVINYLSKLEGDRILVIASTGYLSEGIELGQTQDSVISEALRAGVIINSLDLKGLYAQGPGGGVEGLKELNEDTKGQSSYALMYDSIIRGQRLTAMTASLGEMSIGTGGFFFQNNNDLGKGFHRLVDAPAVEYVMTFAPANLKSDGKFHKIQVKLANQNSYAIESRRGYYAPTRESEKAAAIAEQQSPEQKFEREAIAVDSLADLSAELSVQPGRDKDGAFAINVDIHVDISKLDFQQQKDRHVQQLNFIVALFDDKGNFVTGKQGQMNLAFKDASFDRFLKTGIDAKFSIPATAGAYRVRGVTRETVSNRMAAASREVAIY